MKNIKIVTGIFLLLSGLLFLDRALAADAGRNPFNEPPKKPTPYNYYQASKQMSLTGIIRFEDTERCMVRVGGGSRIRVLSPRETVTVRIYGKNHTFTVSEIREKNVAFTAANGKIYEVDIQ